MSTCSTIRASWLSWAAWSAAPAAAGRDSIDHAPGGHDDIANAAAGALGLALARPVAQLRSADFIIGRMLESATMFPDCRDWRTAFEEHEHADW